MADTSIKLSGTYDSIEAYRILEEMRDMSEDYEDIKTEAEAAASAATAASTAATNAVNAANTAVSNAQTYAGNANASASDAAEYAANASTSATNAATSETNASNSASAAATSASNAATSETNASDSATAAAASAAEVEAALDDYLPLSGGTMTGEIKKNGFVVRNSVDDSYTEYLAGTDETSSYIAMYGKSHQVFPGLINIRAHNGTNNSYLSLEPTGSMTWGGREVERVFSSGTNYIRYESGFQICWGETAASNTKVKVTFPVAFSASPKVITGAAGYTVTPGVVDITTTYFNAWTSASSAAATVYWVAVGKWK